MDDLAKGAGISRPTFYFYFPSKDAVLFALFERAIHEMDVAFEQHNQSPTRRPTATRCAARHQRVLRHVRSHRGVTRAAHEVRASHPEVRELLVRFMDKWIDQHRRDHRGRARPGLAPMTLPARDLATALNLMNERALFASFTDEQPSIAPERLLDTLDAHLGHQHLRRTR